VRIARNLAAAAAGYFALLMLLTQHPSRTVALRNAHQLVAVERGTGLASVESLLDRGWLGAWGDGLYVGLHFGVTVLVVVGLVVARPAVWRDARWLLAGVLVASAVVFWLLPVAPPWMLGRPDGTPWSHPAGAASGLDVYAAMPSLHVACASWVAWSLRRSGVGRAVWLYPLFVSVVVVSTGNHYVLDAVAGWLLLQLAVVAVVGVRSLHRGPTGAAMRGEVPAHGYGC